MDGQITLNEWIQWREDIRQKLQETMGNFVFIGYRLKQIRDSGMYDGCASVYEFAEREYGLDKSTVSRFMAINDKFSKRGNSVELRDEFVGLKQSQLVEMLALPVSDYELVTEATTVKDIRELKSFEKEAMNAPEGDTEAAHEDARKETPEEDHGSPEETASSEEAHEGAQAPAADEAVATSQQREWTPLQKCIIDFFKNRLDLLEEISPMLDEREIAEAIAPSGCTTHRKGIVFLTMMDYGKGVKYKQMGVPLPISMSWEKFYGEIHEIFFDHADDYKEHLCEIYPESVQKDLEIVNNSPVTVAKQEISSKTDEKPQKTEENGKEPREAAADDTPEEKTELAAAEKGKEDTTADDGDVKIYEPGKETAKEDGIPAAGDDGYIQAGYAEMYSLLSSIRHMLDNRKWASAIPLTGKLSALLQNFCTTNQADINRALDAQFDNEEDDDG